VGKVTESRRRSMDRVIRLWAIASLMLFPLHNQAVGGRIMNANSDNILIQWTSEGGLEKSLPAMADLTVFADGRVEVGPRFAHGTVTKRQLSEAELAALRRFVFDEQDIWSIDATALDSAVKAVAKAGPDAGSHAGPVQPLGIEAVADAATTVIRVSDGERTHQISHYNLFDAVQRYPQINELQRLRAIERRLLELAQQVGATER
jgi:stage V sporulation protein SpoVS